MIPNLPGAVSGLSRLMGLSPRHDAVLVSFEASFCHVDESVLSMGRMQDSFTIRAAAEIVSRIAQDAERSLTGRVTRFIRNSL